MSTNTREFKVGDVVQIGTQGEKGRIIDIVKPLGTYSMYKVHSYMNGTVHTAARHELVKGIPDCDFQNLFDCYDALLSDDLVSNVESDVFNVESEQSNSACVASLSPVACVSANSAATQRQLINPPETSTGRAVSCRSLIGSESDKENIFPTPMKISKSAGTQISKRFAAIPVDPKTYREENKNKNTENKTRRDIALVQAFLKEKGEERELFNIPPKELNVYLQEFVIRVRQKNGQEYEPGSIRGMISSIDRYLQEHEYTTSVAKGSEFALTMSTFGSKSKDLKRQGKGNKDHAANDLSNAELEQLFQTGQFGCGSPDSLINSLWYNNTTHFGIRGGGTEHRQLMWGDVKLGFDDELQCEYLEYNERQTKTRTGVNPSNIRLQKPRVYATGTDRCPVRIYKEYASHRPDNFSGDDHPFYLATVTHTKHPAARDQWFLSMPIGRNKLATLLKVAAQKAELPGLHQGKRLSNTSARKRLCQTMLGNGVPDNQAVHITGHKNTNSLNNYRVLTNVQQKSISDLLAGSRPSSASTGPISCHDRASSVTQTQNNVAHQSAYHHDHVSVPSNSAFCLFSNSTITGGTFNITINGKPDTN